MCLDIVETNIVLRVQHIVTFNSVEWFSAKGEKMSLLKNSNLGKCEDEFGYHL